MKLYADYLKERKLYEVISDDFGFATYGHMEVDGGPAIYIEELYVAPEWRKKGIASKYADEIAKKAKEMGINKILGSVSPTCIGAHESMLILIAYGFKLHSCVNDLIYFVKEI